MLAEFDGGLDGVTEAEVRDRLVRIERTAGGVVEGPEALRHLYDDVLALKYLHQRYTNYLAWLTT